MLEIIAWLVVGGLAGWVASMIVKTNENMGVFANIVVGIVGAFLGGFLFKLLTGADTSIFSVGGFIVAVLGACLLLVIVRKLSSRV